MTIPSAPAALAANIQMPPLVEEPPRLTPVDFGGASASAAARPRARLTRRETQTLILSAADKDAVLDFARDIGVGAFYYERGDLGTVLARFTRAPGNPTALTGAANFYTLQCEIAFEPRRVVWQAAAGFAEVGVYGSGAAPASAGFASGIAGAADLAQMPGKTADVVRSAGGGFVWNDNDVDKQGLVSAGLSLADGERRVIALRARRASDATYPLSLGVASRANSLTAWNTNADGGKAYFVFVDAGLRLYKWGVSPSVYVESVAAASPLFAAALWRWHVCEVARAGAAITTRATIHDGAGNSGAVAAVTTPWTAGDELFFHIGGAALNGYYSWDDSMERIAIGKRAAGALTDAELQALTADDFVVFAQEAAA